MATIALAREWLLGIKRQVERPVGFYIQHRASWRDSAAQIARATLLQLRPETVPVEKWREQVEKRVEGLVVELIDEEVVGLSLWMLRSSEPSAPGVTPYATAVDFETIVEWVAAGRAGEEGGKDLKDWPGGRDYNQGDRAIAWRVFHAIRLNKNPRLLPHILEWAGTAGTSAVFQAVDNVELAWEAFFSVQAPRDMERWLGEVCRE